MRVLFITRKWSQTVGGMETYATELTTALARHCELTCVVPSPGNRIRVMQFLEVAWSVFRGRRDQPPYDVVHLADVALLPLAFHLRKKFPEVPIVVSAMGRDVTFQDSPTLAGRLYRLYCRLTRNAPVDAFIAISDFTAAQVRSRYRQPVFTIPLAGRAPCLPLPPPAARDSVLFVGRIAARKGVDWFVERVLPQLPDVKLILTGRNYLPKARFEWLRSHPQVIYTPVEKGAVPAEIRTRAFVCVVPNRESPSWDPEGFGIVAVEHALTGRPTLVTATQGLTSAVVDGVTGFLMPPDPEAWVEKLKSIRNWSDTEFAEFSARCSTESMARFSWERVASDTLEVYRKVSRAGGRPE